MKNKKGFTLIEIMIAIAIIGILALVLVPRVASMRNQAKLAGVDTNMRIAQGVIENIVSNYDPSQANEDNMIAIEDEIAQRLGSTDANKGIKNPITGNMGTGLVADAATKAFVNSTGDEVAATDDVWKDRTGTPTDPTDGNTALSGVIVYNAYWTTSDGVNTIKVRLVPYDDSGNRMTGKIKIIAQ